MKIFVSVLILSVIGLAACVAGSKTDVKPENAAAQKPSANAAAPTNADAAKEVSKGANANVSDDVSEAIPVSKSECLRVDAGDNEIVKNQTFPIDFAPFTKACFVTSHNPEYDDPPLESEFAVYKNGKRIFDFPGQFNGVSFGCWVEAVAFEDLNGDDLKDVVVVGKCSAKTAPYNENMVYVNDGRAFTTNEDANYKLADFKKVKEITDFVRKNQQIFFK